MFPDTQRLKKETQVSRMQLSPIPLDIEVMFFQRHLRH